MGVFAGFGVAWTTHEDPSQYSTSVSRLTEGVWNPAAQTSPPGAAVTLRSSEAPEPRLLTIDQALPSQCSVSVAGAPPLDEENPTAHTSLGEIATTLSRRAPPATLG